MVVLTIQVSGGQWIAMQVHAWSQMAEARVEMGQGRVDAIVDAVLDREACEHCRALADSRRDSEAPDEKILGAEEMSKLPNQVMLRLVKSRSANATRVGWQALHEDAAVRVELPAFMPPRWA